MNFAIWDTIHTFCFSLWVGIAYVSHIVQGYFTGTKVIMGLPLYQDNRAEDWIIDMNKLRSNIWKVKLPAKDLEAGVYQRDWYSFPNITCGAYLFEKKCTKIYYVMHANILLFQYDKIAPTFGNVSEYRLITKGVQNPKPRKTICKAQWLTNGAYITPLGNRDEATKLAYVNTAYATKTQHVLLSLRDVVPFIVYDIKNGSRDFLVYFSVSWRHQMEIFCALLAFSAGNSPVTGEFPEQKPVTRSFDIIFDLRLYKPLSKQSWGWWFETQSLSLWRHCIG